MSDQIFTGTEVFVVHDTLLASLLLTIGDGADLCQDPPVQITLLEDGTERFTWRFQPDNDVMKVVAWYYGPANQPFPEGFPEDVADECRQIRAAFESKAVREAFFNIGQAQRIIAQARKEGVRYCEVERGGRLLLFTENLSPVLRQELEDAFNE